MTFENGPYSVPDDFPHPQATGTVAGTQPKLLLTAWDGKFYTGLTPPERHARWEIIEDLAQQIIAKISASRTSKYAALTENEILGQYSALLVQSDFGSEQEMRWLIRRVAQVLGWPAPAMT